MTRCRRYSLVMLLVLSVVAWMSSPGFASTLAHWSFDETSGIDVADSGGLGNNGQLMNTGGDLNAAGVFNSGVSLTNGADYIGVPHLEVASSSFSIAGWINPTVLENGDEIFGDWSSPWQFRMFLYADGNLQTTLRKDGPNTSNGDLINVYAGASRIQANQYQHVVFTWDRATRLAKIYVNGSLTGQAFTSETALDLKDGEHTEYQIGWKRDDANGKFQGSLDELWVFDEALTADQVQNLMATNTYAAPLHNYLDLAHVIAGGDGMGHVPTTATNVGIDAVNGNVGLAENRYISGTVSPANSYFPVEEYAFVDGVFVPNGAIGAQPIDSDGHTFDFAGHSSSAGSYATWWPTISSGNVDPSWQSDNPDYHSDSHSLISAHAQKGITFDLDAMRAANPTLDLNVFRTTAGLSSGSGSIYYAVLLDGQLRREATFSGATGKNNLIVPVAGASKLTLVIADAGNGIGSDHGYFGDAQVAHQDVSKISLADVVGGGYGYGDGTLNVGIHPVTGAVNQNASGNLVDPAPGTYHMVTGSQFVDGVFTPNGTIGSQPIDSDGHTVDFAGVADASPAYASFINGVAHSDPSLLLGQPDYRASGHSLISAHAQKGITFDLDALRAANPHLNINMFQANIGLSHSGGSVTYMVLVDGELMAQNSFAGAVMFDRVNIPISSTASKLTLISTNSNINVNSADHTYFGDAFLTEATLFPFDLADAVGGGNGFGTGTASGIDAVTGTVGTGGASGRGFPAVAGTYESVEEYAFVDGVFLPDGTILGGQQITSAGDEFDFAGLASHAESYGDFFNGLNGISNPSSVNGLPDYVNGGYSLLSSHAQKGITFDLDAIRLATGMETVSFTSIVGESAGQAGGSVVYVVLLDGTVVASGSLAGNEALIDVPVGADAQYLTLVMTNANDDNSSDHGYFVNPFVNLTPVPEPGSLVLLLLGLVGMATVGRRWFRG